MVLSCTFNQHFQYIINKKHDRYDRSYQKNCSNDEEIIKSKFPGNVINICIMDYRNSSKNTSVIGGTIQTSLSNSRG